MFTKNQKEAEAFLGIFILEMFAVVAVFFYITK